MVHKKFFCACSSFIPCFAVIYFFVVFDGSLFFPGPQNIDHDVFFLLLRGEVNSVIGTPEGFNQKKAYKVGPYQL